MAEEPLISLSEAAGKIGVHKSTVSRQVRNGALRSHGGKVYLSEVLEDRAANINLRQAVQSVASQAREPSGAAADTTGSVAQGKADGPVVVDGVVLSFTAAQALKETYLARLRQLEFEIKSGHLIDRERVERVFFEVSRENRDAWSAWPARISTEFAAEAGIEGAVAADLLRKYVHEHLTELGEPEADFAG